MKLEELKVGQSIEGLAFDGPATLRGVEWIGPDRVQVTYKTNRGLDDRVVGREDEAGLKAALSTSPFSFEGDAQSFRLAAEARRISLAYLFDPYLALTSSQIEPLPHQITAVYGSMLDRQPLRFLLADDPGAGKTIMAGLLIKELMLRGDLKRALIVAPGSLVDQWQDELEEKFALSFQIVTRDMLRSSYGGNPFQDNDRLILRLDMAARSEELQELIEQSSDFDLVICDEAHRMSASFTGGEVKYTKRFLFGRKLAAKARNFLLMTATPHNGKDDDFQLFLSLLDADRFEGAHREGVRSANAQDLMRRSIKEELYWFDGRPLFPERRAYTVSYPLSALEAELYTAVTEYVRDEMNRVERFASDEKKRMSVGFALQSLQRRLASSPRAIWRSLKRRKDRLQKRLEEEELRGRSAVAAFEVEDEVVAPSDDDFEELPEDELEQLENDAIDRASTAATLEELKIEIESLSELEKLALGLCQSGEDTKWQELASILNQPPVYDHSTGRQKKVLVFTEPRDTLDYLEEKIGVHLGDPEAVKVIHGGVPRKTRRAIVAAFNDDPKVRVLLANDAAGEGVNLQRGAHLMVNYDLPWNPNKLEQRFGRIHRIGQVEVCHLWNLVAGETREGAVYQRLLEKLEAARLQLGGKVFDVLGEAFEGKKLREMLFEAVQYGERDDVRERLFQSVDGAVDTDRMRELTERARLSQETLDASQIDALRHEMERAKATRLQPYYIRSFFMEAFSRAGGIIEPREAGRYEILRVPTKVRLHDHLTGSGDPVLERYLRVTFDKENVQGDPGEPMASLIAPGHPLLDALIDIVLEANENVLKQGTVLVLETNISSEPKLLAMIEHEVRDGVSAPDGRARCISQEMQFVLIDEQGQTIDAGAAPYLDCRPLRDDEVPIVEKLLTKDWLTEDLLEKVRRFAGDALASNHLEKVRSRRLAHIEKVEEQVKLRLKKDVAYWSRRAAQYDLEIKSGKDKRLAKQQAQERAQRSADRLEERLATLKRERSITSAAPQVIGGALVVPASMFPSRGDNSEQRNVEDTRTSELLGMKAVSDAEIAAGRNPRDVSLNKFGWDIESVTPEGDVLFLEVKARVRGSKDIVLTKNEILQAKNAGDQYHLVIVIHEDGVADQPIYVSNPGPHLGDPGNFEASEHKYPLANLIAKGSNEPNLRRAKNK